MYTYEWVTQNLCHPPLGVGVLAWLQPGEITPSTVGIVQAYQGQNSLSFMGALDPYKTLFLFFICLSFNNLLLPVPNYYP